MNNLVPLKFCLYDQTGGSSKFSKFIPYEEHHLMTKEDRILNPIYCPDLTPFLCNKDALGNGFCKKTDKSCDEVNTLGERIPLVYKG